MNKIDLIIDALELARNEIHDPTLWTDKVDKTLAAARELREIKPESHHLGMMLNPYYKECNIRIDWGVDGGIYKVEWQNEV